LALRGGPLAGVLEALEARQAPVADEALLLLLQEAAADGGVHSRAPALRRCARCLLRWRAAHDGAMATLTALLAGEHAAAACGSCRGACDADDGRASALHVAAARGHAAAVAALLARAHGGGAVNARDEEQQDATPLMLAAAAARGSPGALGALTALLGHAWCHVDAADESLRTALSHAAGAGAARACGALLARGADPLARERTPPSERHADEAPSDADEDSLSALLLQLPGCAMPPTAGGAELPAHTPLHRAAAAPRDAGALCVRLLAAAARARGRSLDARDTSRRTPLACAAAAGAWPACVALAHAGVRSRRVPSSCADALPLPLRAFLAAPGAPVWTPEVHALHPPRFRDASRALLLCALRGRRRIALADAAGAAAVEDEDDGACLGRLPHALLLLLLACLAREWCAAPPWPHEFGDDA
jgi:hypothetical protein